MSNTAINNNTITGTLVYVSVQTPTKKYGSETEKEYKAGVVVDEDTADAWEEMFPKQAAKAIKTSEFEDFAKIKPVFPDAKKQYIITLKKPAQYANGNPIPQQYTPKVFLRDNDAALDITESALPANGSKGVLSFETAENKYGTFAKLKNVLVTDLIEYKKSGGDGASDFGLKSKTQSTVENEFSDVKQESKATPKPKSKVEEPSDLDDDLPF